MVGRRLLVGAACCAATLVVDTPAAASTCVPPGEFVELVLEEVTVDGVVAPKPDARARLDLSGDVVDGANVTGLRLVDTEGTTELYEPIRP